jgi:GntR family transcriptional repressor for pyruvate dehydrogenase complex
MPYIKITQPKLADAIVAELESMILEGSLAAGPEVAARAGTRHPVSGVAPFLREAIQRLEARTLVSSSGRWHLRTKCPEQGDRRPLFELLSTHPEAQYDLLEFRHALEGICAYYAALRGTEADFERIRWRKPPSKKPVSKGRWWSNRPP